MQAGDQTSPVRLRLCALSVFALAHAASWAAPDCLIVQLRDDLVEGKDPNFALTSFVADQLDKDGRVRPVVWSLTDPVFRQWTNRDVFGDFDPNPDQAKALETSRKLGVRYVLVVRGNRDGQDMFAVAELFNNGRSVWRFGPRKPNKRQDIVIQTDGRYDERATKAFQSKMPDLLKAGGTFTVYQGGVPDQVETARSVASTWAALLGDGPLKDLPSKPRLTDPNSNQGSPIEPADVQGPVEAGADNVIALVKELIAQDKHQKALILLREACDRQPFDVETRRLMVETMISLGMAQEAADAAQAATRLTPQDPGVWLTAAQAWVAASDADKAEQNMAEAKARGCEPGLLLETEGDLALLKGDTKTALVKFKSLESGNATVRRAIAHALSGDAQACIAALKVRGEEPLNENQYRATIHFVERALLGVSDSAKAILPTIRLHPGAPETLSDARNLANLTQSLSELLAHVKPPKIHSDSHEARKLAHILLAQAAMEALDFAERNDPDTGEESAATFAQAFMLFPGVKEKFSLERKYGG